MEHAHDYGLVAQLGKLRFILAAAWVAAVVLIFAFGPLWLAATIYSVSVAVFLVASFRGWMLFFRGNN